MARGAFGPTVIVGIGAGAAAAWAAHREWAAVAGGPSASSQLIAGSVGEAPLVAALSLVSLAAWGVLLLTRGRIRKAAAWLALIAAGSVIAASVAALRSVPGALAERLDQVAAHGGGGGLDVALTPWGWMTLACAVLVAAAALVACRTVGTWPEMSGRYDAPRAEESADPTDIWKALDEGRDPTTGP